jgi:hypothetical protein
LNREEFLVFFVEKSREKVNDGEICFLNDAKDGRHKEMNLKKRWKPIVLLGTIMGSCFTAGVYAQDAMEQVQAFLRSDYSVVVDGQKVNLANPPLIYNNNSYLPVKELSGYLGGVVNWQADTKTIYINSKINSEQPETGDITYDEIKLTNPRAYYLTYLGGEYPMLITTASKLYYREKDLKRMGIDTNGLRKAKEKYTGDIFLSEDEVSKRWKEKPNYSSSKKSSIVVTGEENPDKLKALKEYSDSMKTYTINDIAYYRSSVIIDALPEEDEYEYLYKENNHFFRAHLKLTKWTNEGEYLVNSSSTENIEVETKNTQSP